MKAIIDKKVELGGLNLHIVPSKKYKTISIVAKFKAPLNRETITKRVLLPHILRQGTKTYPTRADLQYKLDDLYGASLSLDSSKVGDHHVISVRMEITNQKYIQDESSIIENAIALLNEVVSNPNTEGQAFSAAVVEREKKALQQQIRSIIDDKDHFAQIRLVDEMCQGEPYQIHEQGYEEDLAGITPENLYEYHQSWIQNDELDLYILGDFDEKELTRTVEKIMNRKKPKDHYSASGTINKKPDTLKEIIEVQDLQQSKLHLGYRTGITYKDRQFASLLIFDSLFGGYPGSKLFLNVREKHSLAYYVGSGFDTYTGLLFVTSGIAAKDYEKTRKIIDEQVQAMQDGDFTDLEVEEIKKLTASQFLEAMDYAQGLIELLYQNELGGRTVGLESLLDDIQQVTKEDVMEVANQVVADTVYFLTSKEKFE